MNTIGTENATQSLVINVNNFNKTLDGVVRGSTKQRDILQLLLCFGLAHYAEHGDTCYLTKTLNACIGVKSLPTKTMKTFIQQHANVTWNKATDGNMVFKKAGSEVVVKTPTTLWFNASKDHQAMPDMNILARFNGLMTSLNTALIEGKIKEGQRDFAQKLYDTLDALKNDAEKVEVETKEAKAA